MVDGDADGPVDGADPTPDDDLGIDYLRDVVAIGRGGFASVYAATDTRFDRRVAVKVFDQFLTDDDRALFETECRTTGRLWRIPNIITVHDVEYTKDGQPCIVMAYLEAGSLGDQLRRHGLIPWRRAVRYLVTVLDALDAAHRHGVLHRDIKPENILLEGDEAYLTDFGLATVSRAAGEADVGTAQVIASPLHAPPETFDGGHRDERSDVYSAASTLYNLIAGHAPFQRHADLSPPAIVERLRTQQPARIPAGLAPPELDAVIQRALAKDPAERHQSAAELAGALRAFLDGRATRPHAGPAVPAPPASWPAAGAAVAPVPAPAPAPAPSPGGTGSAPFVASARSALTQSGPVAPASTSAASAASPASAAPPASAAGQSSPGPTPPQASSWGRRQPPAPVQPVAATPGAGAGAGPVPGAAKTPPSQPFGLRLLSVVAIVTAAIIVYTVIANANDPGQSNVIGSPEFGPGTTRPPTTRQPPTTNPSPIDEEIPAGLALRWAEDRAAVVADIEANRWGWNQEARTVSGPGGLLVDLRACPAGWNPYQGLFTNEVYLGQITPNRRTAELQDNAEGFEAYMQWVSDVGGGLPSAGGARRITVDPVKDSSIDPEPDQLTTEAFAVRRLASAGVDPAAEEQGAACVPNPFVPFDEPGWTDPAGHPWAWADHLSASAQGWLVGETLARSLPDDGQPRRVTALVTSGDVARAAGQALQAYVARSPAAFELTVTEIGGDSTDIGRAMLDLASAPTRPNAVAVLTGSSGACGDAAIAAVNAGSARLLVTTSACATRNPAVDPLATTTWLTVGDPRQAPDGADPDGWNRWASTVLAAAGHPAPQSAALLDGFASAWSMHQSMLIADQLPGGLSRPNLLLAARALRLENPSLLGGVGYGMGGGADGDLIEGAPILRYRPSDSRWEASDLGVIDLSGQVPPCAWDRSARSCA